jgi:tetratricopeptide (TPR) repeat protein
MAGHREAPKSQLREQAERLLAEGRELTQSVGTRGGPGCDPWLLLFPPFLELWGAVHKYSQALRLCPDYAEAYAYRALAYDLLRPIWIRMLFGPSRRAIADARRAFECRPDQLWIYHILAMPLPPEERVAVLREGLSRAREDDRHRFVLWHELAQALWEAHDFQACVRELETLIRLRAPHDDLLGNSRNLLCWAYEALGEYRAAERTYQEMLSFCFDEAAQHGTGYEELRRHAPDADHLFAETRLRAIAGLVRSRMRCDDFAGALAATERWRQYLPDDRVAINVAVLEVMDGREPTNIPALLPVVAECAGRDYYYGFFAGVLFAHAGRGSQALRFLRRFQGASTNRSRLWGATEGWERTRAEQLIEKLGSS